MANKMRTVWALVFSLLAIAALTTALLVFFLPKSENRHTLTFVKADYADSADSLFVRKTQTFAETDQDLLPFHLLNALLRGPETADPVSPFPSGTRILSFRQAEQTIYVDFSDAYSRLDPFSLALADYCMAETLTGVEGIARFFITVEGAPHPFYPDGFSLSNFLTGGQSLIPSTETVTLYFPHPDNTYLMPRQEALTLYSDSNRLIAALETLFHGPEGAPALAIAPPDTAILSVSESDGIVTVNLSRAFLDYNRHGASQAKMIIYAIVNTLTGLSSAEAVQFFIEGEVISFYGDVPMRLPVYRDASLIFGIG